MLTAFVLEVCGLPPGPFYYASCSRALKWTSLIIYSSKPILSGQNKLNRSALLSRCPNIPGRLKYIKKKLT